MFATAIGTVLISCLLANFPGPPELKIDNLNPQLYPVDRVQYPGIDPDRDVIFELFTSDNTIFPEVLKPGSDDITNIDFSKRTVMFFHGFMESSNSTDCTGIRDAFLRRRDHNVILVNMRRLLAGPFYLTAFQNTIPIGTYAANFIDELVRKGLSLSDLHVIGHSLGGQIAGITGSLIKSGKVDRITGLDPAGSLFWFAPESLRLDSSDAEFVDVIHTNDGVFGYPQECGHVDFFPNGGGGTQPGCHPLEISRRNFGSVVEQVFCSHWKSYQFFIESINNDTAFLATKCNSWSDYQSGGCNSGEKANMGEGVQRSARGRFYLRTNPSEPYSM